MFTSLWFRFLAVNIKKEEKWGNDSDDEVKEEVMQFSLNVLQM